MANPSLNKTITALNWTQHEPLKELRGTEDVGENRDHYHLESFSSVLKVVAAAPTIDSILE